MLSHDVSLSDRLVIAPHIVWRDVEGDLVLFDEQDGRYFGLNPVASFLWRRIGRGMAISAIRREASVDYAGDPMQVAADITAFLDGALALNLLLPVDHP